MKDLGYKVYDKHIAFWGSPLSNFYPCEFDLDDEILLEIGKIIMNMPQFA